MITADTIRAARERLHRYGLRKDGNYGEYDGPCCTVGHPAAVLHQLDPHDPRYLTSNETVSSEVGDAFSDWTGELADPDYLEHVTLWNDTIATVDDVDAFYAWWIEQLEAGQ